jgi:hypothetical protein
LELPVLADVGFPREFQFTSSEEFEEKQADAEADAARPKDWSAYLAVHAVASEEFMQNVEKLPVQERAWFPVSKFKKIKPAGRGGRKAATPRG